MQPAGHLLGRGAAQGEGLYRGAEPAPLHLRGHQCGKDLHYTGLNSGDVTNALDNWLQLFSLG